MKRIFPLLLILASTLSFTTSAWADPPVPSLTELAQRVQETIHSCNEQNYYLKMRERLKPSDPLSEWNTLHIKFRQKPYAIYLKYVDGPHKGRESMFVEGKYKNKLIAREGWMKFPVKSVAIDPHGNKALAVAHRSITQSGLHFMAREVERGVRRHIQEYTKKDESHLLNIEGPKPVVDDGVECYYVKVSAKKDKWLTYEVQESDRDLFDIAKKIGPGITANELWYCNEHLRGYKDIRPGQKLRYPELMGVSLEFWFYKDTLFNRRYVITDWEGRIYEEYFHYDIKVNEKAGITEKDFDKKNPEYGF